MPRFSHRSQTSRIVLLAALALGALSSTSALAQSSGTDSPRPGEPVVSIISRDTKLTLVELQTRLLELGNRIRAVDGHDPDVLTIIPVSNQRVRLKAEKSGVTSFTLTDEFDNIYTVEVFVDADVRELQAYLGRLFPGAAIEVVGLNGSVVLRGWVTEPQQIPQIMDVAEKFSPIVLNQMNVGGVSTVQLQVKVMEVQRSKLRQFGFNFLHVGQQSYFASTPGGLAPLQNATLPFGGPPSVTVQPGALANQTMQFAITGSSDIFQAFIEAVETESLAKVMADTALVTNSGRPATLLAGGQFPILVPQQLGTVTIEYREFGVRMEALPIVLGNGRLRLQVSPEVSERDVSSAVVVNGFTVPGVTLRRVNTEVEMRFGETLMLGGLILQRELVSNTKVPFLGDLPYIGSAFSRRRSEIGDTELLIMLTPHMAAPLAAGQLPITGPGTNSEATTSHEFYFDGFVEVPNYNPPPETLGGMMDAGYPPSVPGYSPGPVLDPGFLPPVQTPAHAEPHPDDAMPSASRTDGVQQTSALFDVRARDRDRGTTLGTMRPFATTSQSRASVKSNSGDNIRGTTGGHSTSSESADASGRRLELVEPAPAAPRSWFSGGASRN
ncbi:MAG: pilus assembly protein N-terminal domain-containing protein [Planctomyces sp.]|nr:pilus assembly protein N-terminal domain-containing protein [Planctomyces sp.]